MPEAAALAKLRRNIDRRPQQVKSVLSSSGIRKEYLGGVPKDEKKVMERFVAEHKDTSLKTKPKVSELCLRTVMNVRRVNLQLIVKVSPRGMMSAPRPLGSAATDNRRPCIPALCCVHC